MSRDALIASLDAVSAQGDPAARVYARLFAMHPELERLFAYDRDGGVRGSMMQQAVECVLDFAEGGRMGASIIASSRLHHQGYGVPDGMFEAFFEAMRDAFRELLGEQWTEAMEREWAGMIAEFRGVG